MAGHTTWRHKFLVIGDPKALSAPASPPHSVQWAATATPDTEKMVTGVGIGQALGHQGASGDAFGETFVPSHLSVSTVAILAFVA